MHLLLSLSISSLKDKSKTGGGGVGAENYVTPYAALTLAKEPLMCAILCFWCELLATGIRQSFDSSLINIYVSNIHPDTDTKYGKLG